MRRPFRVLRTLCTRRLRTWTKAFCKRLSSADRFPAATGGRLPDLKTYSFSSSRTAFVSSNSSRPSTARPDNSSRPCSNFSKSQATQAALKSFEFEPTNLCTESSFKLLHIAKTSQTEVVSKKLANPPFSASLQRPAHAWKTTANSSNKSRLSSTLLESIRFNLWASESSACFSGNAALKCRLGRDPYFSRNSATAWHTCMGVSSGSFSVATNNTSKRFNTSSDNSVRFSTTRSQRWANASSDLCASPRHAFCRFGKNPVLCRNSTTAWHTRTDGSSFSVFVATNNASKRFNTSSDNSVRFSTKRSQRWANASSDLCSSLRHACCRFGNTPPLLLKNSCTATHVAIAPSSVPTSTATKRSLYLCCNSKDTVSAFWPTRRSQRRANKSSFRLSSSKTFWRLGNRCALSS